MRLALDGLTLRIPRVDIQVQKAKAAVGGSGADDFIGKTVKVLPTPHQERHGCHAVFH